MPVATEEAKLTKAEIKDLKQEIKALYSNYVTARIELALKLYQLQEALAMPGRGTFTAMVRDELGVPISTCYDLIDLAKEEIRLTRLSESRKDGDDITFDWDELYRLIVKRYPTERKMRPREPKPYVKKSQLHFIWNVKTRQEVAAAWKILKRKENKEELKALSQQIAKEVIRAATDVEKSSK